MSLASCIPHLDLFDEDACRLDGVLKTGQGRLGKHVEEL